MDWNQEVCNFTGRERENNCIHTDIEVCFCNGWTPWTLLTYCFTHFCRKQTNAAAVFVFISALHFSPVSQTVWTVFLTSLLTVLYVSLLTVTASINISNCTHMKEMTSCAEEDFSWEGIIRQWMFRLNVKEFIIMKLLRGEKLMFTLRCHDMVYYRTF